LLGCCQMVAGVFWFVSRLFWVVARLLLGGCYGVLVGWRFPSHDVISARKIFYLLNMFLAQKYLILNFPYILIDYVI